MSSNMMEVLPTQAMAIQQNIAILFCVHFHFNTIGANDKS